MLYEVFFEIGVQTGDFFYFSYASAFVEYSCDKSGADTDFKVFGHSLFSVLDVEPWNNSQIPDIGYDC